MRSTIKRVISVLLVVCMMISCVPMAYATEKPTPTDVSSALQLETALNSGAQRIRITADFTLDRTFYISGDTTIYADSPHMLKRAPGFGGDIFVVGEDKSGKSSILLGKTAHLTLGDPDISGNDILVLDGNKDTMTVDVTGTVLFICNGSDVDIYDGVSFVNSHKDSNQKTYGEDYVLSYPERIGGAAAIVANGTLNIYGGRFANNSVNNEDTSEGAPADARDSSQGGAIYNYGNLEIYGGIFENNVAARGGAIYNYRTLRLDTAEFKSNSSYSHGGAVYQAGSQYANIVIGYADDSLGNSVLFENNTAATNGGAIYLYTQSSLLGYGRATFRANTASTAAGGAICAYGSVTLRNTVFEDNSAATRGGALYLSNADETLTARIHGIDSCVFQNNTATSGGAAALFSGDSSMPEGATAHFTNCEFEGNCATSESNDSYGGALYVHRKSTLFVNSSEFDGNTATTEGGAIYASGESSVSIEGAVLSHNTSDDVGGAISVRSSYLSAKDTDFNQNSADKNGGAIYVAYVGDSAVNSDVVLDGSTFTENTAVKYGGAVYATEHEIEKDTRIINSKDTIFEGNTAQKGGAVYITSGVEAYFAGGEFNKNQSTSADGDDTNGAAIYSTESTLKMDGSEFTQNSAGYNGGGIGAYSGSTVILNDITADGNNAKNAGGFIYNSGSDIKMYESTVKNNSVTNKTGGAMSLHSEGTTAVYDTVFEGNSAKTHGGAVYVYPGATETILQDIEFKSNKAGSYGGAVYVSNAAKLKMYNIFAESNSAKNGGVLYETTTDTEVTLNGMTVSGNTASDGGTIIWGNTKNAKLYINKTNFSDNDVEGALDDEYWSTAIANTVTVIEITDAIDAYTPYVPEEDTVAPPPAEKTPVPVTDVLTLGLTSSDGEINATYSGFKKLDNSSNFMSRGTKRFENINGGTVTVDSFVYQANKVDNNPNVGQGILIYQAMLYKQAHPEENVSIDISSFHFSGEVAVCINRDSRYFGYMRALTDRDYDEFGFVRIAYLLVSAAKMGIDVTVVGQLEGYPKSSASLPYAKYFESHLTDPCDPAYAEGTVGDYLDFQYCNWTSYGENGATDMMHVKVCAVSHYLDMNGVPHKNTVWTSSVNIDGINSNGTNGNNLLQAGVIISDHEMIYRVASNYLDLMAEYCGQEDIYLFRDLVNRRNTEQIDLILAGKAASIPADEQIVYIGSETDDVFELYFAPFGGDRVVWDEAYNPYTKYLRNLYDSEGSIVFIWNNAKYDKPFALGKQMEHMIIDAFHKNKNPDNKIYLNLQGFDTAAFDDLTVGTDIGLKSFNKYEYGGVHSKDIQMSYVKDGQRYYVTLLNSMNMHGGSMYYQTNQMLVIKETECTGTSVFFDIANHTTKGVVPISDDSSAAFDDVENKWYKAAIDYCWTNGFIAGMSATEYGVSTPITRGMFITVLARMAGVDTSKEANSRALSKFNDVAVGRYYSSAIKWASENGVVAGVSATEFKPDSPILRQQLCVMIVNFAKHQGIGIKSNKAVTPFADAEQIQNYAKSAVSICQSAGIVNGYNEGGKTLFKPTATATRAEAAQILYKFHCQ